MNNFAVLILASMTTLVLGAPQFNGDPSLAKILQEQRFNMGDGRFGHAATQEDGVIIKEESSGGNNRIGEYQYIGDDGKTYTVRYEAGVNGFRILSGDHIPSGGQNAAAANVTGGVEYDYEYYDDRKPDSPFVNPHDPTHQQPELLAGNLAGHLAGVFRDNQATVPSTTARPGVVPGSLTSTTTETNRFFPPGELQLDRFPEGFKFDFRSNK